MKRLESLGPDRMRVLRALVAGGKIERRRCYPFPAKHYLVRAGCTESAPLVKDCVVSDLATRGLQEPARRPDLSQSTCADTMDFVATAAASAAVRLRGVEYDDDQLTLLDEPPAWHHTGLEPLL